MYTVYTVQYLTEVHAGWNILSRGSAAALAGFQTELVSLRKSLSNT